MFLTQGYNIAIMQTNPAVKAIWNFILMLYCANWNVVLSQNKGTMHYGLVIVGHSLGAGTAAILSFLLRPQYPTLHCYSYSPPGGLLR